MRAGKLRHRIEFGQNQADPDNPDEETGQVLPQWTALHENVPAEVMEVAGGETIRGGVQVQATTTHVIRCRYRSDISEEIKVTWQGRTLGITHVRDFDGRSRELWIECEEEK